MAVGGIDAPEGTYLQRLRAVCAATRGVATGVDIGIYTPQNQPK